MAAALLLAPQIAGDVVLPPVSETALLAGVKACVGATVDPAGQDARLAGWPAVVGNDPDTAKDGTARRVASKDGVQLVVKTGVDGGCVLRARLDPTIDKTVLFADIGKQVGVTIDPTQSRVDLPNGELMVVEVGGEGGKLFAQVVVANQNGKYAKKSKGN